MAELVLDHVAVAVRSIRAAVPLYRDALGGQYLMGGEAGVTWRWLQIGRRHSSAPRRPTGR